MKLEEFIINELIRIAESEITRSFSNEHSEILFERTKFLLTGNDFPDYEKLLTHIAALGL